MDNFLSFVSFDSFCLLIFALPAFLFPSFLHQPSHRHLSDFSFFFNLSCVLYNQAGYTLIEWLCRGRVGCTL